MTTTAGSLVLLVVLAVPAWAQPTFDNGEVAPASDALLSLAVPEDERIGPTTRVTVTAPSTFALTTCTAPPGWTCEIAGQKVTFAGETPVNVRYVFGVTTPAAPGTYPFPVVQRDAALTSIGWTGSNAPSIVVSGEAADDGTGDDGTDGGTTEDPDPAASEDSGDGGTSTPAPSEDPAAGAEEEDPAEDAADGGSASGSTDPPRSSSSSGSTAPTRTQRSTSGTPLEVTPAQPSDDAQAMPGAEAPAVAGAPSSPSSTSAEGGALALDDGGGTGAQTGVPWQQSTGAALLLTGAVILLVRQVRDRRA